MKRKYLLLLVLVGLVGVGALYYWNNQIELVPVPKSEVPEIQINQFVLRRQCWVFLIVMEK